MKVTLDHVAIWTNNLERLKEFYCKYFEATSNTMYHNEKTGMKSYFLSFKGGARLEIMQKDDIPANANDTIKQHTGIIHLAFDVETIDEVDKMASLFLLNNISILKGPRTTGDGYYEFESLDPDNNRLEITAKAKI